VPDRRLLLVHGFCGAKEDFTDWVEPLAAAGWEAVARDLPGHGANQPAPGSYDYSLDGLASHVLATADELGWDRFVLLGHSMGGMVAQFVALRAPERLLALILMDTAHGPAPGVERSMRDLGASIVRDQGMPALVLAQAAVAADEPEPHLRLVRERPGYKEFCTGKALAAAPDMWVALTAEMLDTPDRLDALSRVALATLVVVGEEDRQFRADCERIASVMPRARLAVVPGGAHSPQFEAPGEWWRAVNGFLEEIG
jgi:pimeloyl-ACP methyl ester carboxylesterase